MERAGKLMRRTIHTFLQNYHSFASTTALLVFPFSASVLLSQSLIPSSSPFQQNIQSRIRSLFDASGLPASAEFFSLLNLRFSQTISSFIFTLPFTLTFLILAKASIIQILHNCRHQRVKSPRFSSFLNLYKSLLLTHLCGSFVILSVNAAIFSILFIAFNLVDVIGLTSSNSILIFSAAGAILYSIVLANTLVACNLGMIVSGMENCGGYLPILKACVLIKGRAATALSLALPANLGMAAVEAWFQFRVVKPYHASSRFDPSVMWEAFSITYMHSLLIVLDAIASFMFLKSCSFGCGCCNHTQLLELEGEDGSFGSCKSQGLP